MANRWANNGNSEGEVAQSCPTLCDPVDCSPPGSPAKYWLDEARIFWIQASGIKIGIKIAVRNISNLRYIDGNPLQYSCLENSMDGGAWWATIHGIRKSQTRLSDFTTLMAES